MLCDMLMLRYGQTPVSLVVVDGLAPILRQGICSYHDGVGLSAFIRSAPFT